MEDKTISLQVLRNSISQYYVSLDLNSLELEKIQDLLIRHYEHLFKLAKELHNPLQDIRIKISHSQLNPIKFQTFKCACIAGTFDHLHVDHKTLLTVAALISSEKLVIGILTPGSSKKLVEYIEPIEKRKEAIREFLEWLKPSLRIEIQEVTRCNSALSCSIVSGIYGKEVEAIVSENEAESRHGCEAINKLRVENGLSELPIVWKKSNRCVSSTELREWIASRAKL